MDSSNYWYGHADVLAAYCGLDPVKAPPVSGVIQHGWTFVHGFGHGHRPPLGVTRLAWSDVCRRRGQLIGWSQYQVIGAPFVYLDAMTPDSGQRREGTIWYPFHGTVDFESVEGDHARLVDDIRQTESGPITVCLYYVEYDQPDVRRYYEDAGFRVITHGARGLGKRRGNTRFLHDQLSELRRHERVASNRLSTAVLYGIAAGCKPAVYGDPMTFDGAKPGFDGTALIDAWYPKMHGHEIDLALAQEFAKRELGTDQRMSPRELAMVLGWEN